MQKLRTEPALVVGALAAVLAVIGVTVTTDQTEAITAGIAAVLAVAQAIATRAKVTPMAGLDAEDHEV